MENYTLNKVISIARENGFEKVSGEYLPTAKNGIVANLLADLGFVGNGIVSCEVASFEDLPTLITAE
jgi:predicted enzyme involved in methoxymalonyl-ACP biosynthesis